MSQTKNKQSGFTLIEILIVIGIIAILATIVIIAINPARQFAQARDTQRTSNVNAILNAVGQRLADNRGTFAGTFTINSVVYTCGPLPTEVSTPVGPLGITTAMATNTTTPTGALGCLVPTYISTLPTDPAGVTAPATNYDIIQNSVTGRITISTTVNEPSIPRTTALTVTR